jgi:hypothetical protein
MICDHYKKALLELAPRGAETDPDLLAHLQACPSCRSALENERSLFASIDSSLRSSANAEIPSSFIPTVRARVLEESSQHRATDRLLWVPALAAAAIILFVFLRLDRRAKPLSTDEQLVTKGPQSPVARQTTAAKPLQGTAPQIAPALGKSFAIKAAITHEKKSVQTESREPEILVTPDQEILLARYADRWKRHHQSSSILLTEIDSAQSDPLQVQLIQIAELDVKPLAPLADDQKYDQESDVRQK